ncbi:hypothetical protein [Pontibacter pamirensis]|uniref:hypothetical protein n=1 Tax=Pontibacter pamirensis TaxID=2562824 RepID=UPI00138A572F|nr:hypothetical protein [Pontibacter pamirensis]
MAIALTLTGLILLVCTLCSALVLLLSHEEEPDRGYGWVQKPDAPMMRIASGCNVEKTPTHLPQHMTVEKAATGS